MTADRDALAELIRKAGWDAQDSPDYEKCGFDSDLFIADAILAAGYRPPCPASDVATLCVDCRRGYHVNHEEHPQWGLQGCVTPGGCDCDWQDPYGVVQTGRLLIPPVD